MKREKIKVFLIVSVCCLSHLLIAGGVTFALLKKASGPVENQFTPGSVYCSVDETFDGVDKTSVKIENTGTVPVYVRIKLVSSWQDENGATCAVAAAPLSFTLGEGWVSAGDGLYYYTAPVNAGGKTGNLIASGSKITLTQKDGLKQVVDVLAEVIQASPKSAVEGAWGVTVGNNGKIAP